jgi:prevent-host-death family protein
VIEIASFDARDQFSRLLDQVQQGEEVVITRRGKPVARIVPNSSATTQSLTGGNRLVASAAAPQAEPTATSNCR